ncbi:MAG: hypothetical protein GXO93_02680 [FCB group bacterium]|nr:hypothetical protein [FCB group bacterium]
MRYIFIIIGIIVLLSNFTGCGTTYFYKLTPEKHKVDNWKLEFYANIDLEGPCPKHDEITSRDSCWSLYVMCYTKDYPNRKTDIKIDSLTILKPQGNKLLTATADNIHGGRFGNFAFNSKEILMELVVKIYDRSSDKLLKREVVKLKGVYKKDRYFILNE